MNEQQIIREAMSILGKRRSAAKTAANRLKAKLPRPGGRKPRKPRSEAV